MHSIFILSSVAGVVANTEASRIQYNKCAVRDPYPIFVLGLSLSRGTKKQITLCIPAEAFAVDILPFHTFIGQ